jgi:hypothetical protein
VVKRLVSLLILAAAVLFVPAGPAVAAPPVAYSNPIANQRADTHVWKHTDGYYYMTATVPEYDRIVLRRATTVQGLAGASETVIWRRHASGEVFVIQARSRKSFD